MSYQAHDALFREVFREKDAIQAYIKHCLPAPFFVEIDLDSLELLPDSFIDEQLAAHFSDVIWQGRLLGPPDAPMVWFISLHEHKSWVEDEAIFQVIRYSSILWDAFLKAKERPVCIFPDLIFHGSGRWKVCSLPDFFDEIPESLRPFIPKFEFHLTNLHDLEADQILELESASLVTAFLLMRYSRDKPAMLAQLEKLGNFVEKLSESKRKERLMLLVQNYLLSVNDYSEAEIMESFTIHRPTLKELADQSDVVVKAKKMALEKGIKQGLEQGIEQGIEQKSRQFVKNMLEAGMVDFAQIASLAEVSIEFVEKMAAELRAENAKS